MIRIELFYNSALGETVVDVCFSINAACKGAFYEKEIKLVGIKLANYPYTQEGHIRIVASSGKTAEVEDLLHRLSLERDLAGYEIEVVQLSHYVPPRDPSKLPKSTRTYEAHPIG